MIYFMGMGHKKVMHILEVMSENIHLNILLLNFAFNVIFKQYLFVYLIVYTMCYSFRLKP